MGLKYIKDRKGKFRGSISDGKDIPTSGPSLPKRPQAGKPNEPENTKPNISIQPTEDYHPRLSIPRQIQLKYNIEEFFETEVEENEALKKSILEGKEIGHTISSDIDEKTSQVLRDAGHPIVHEIDERTQEPKARSFGDIWIRDGDYVNPINVKTGVLNSGSYGNSNMASMSRLKDAYLSGAIDAYYLAIVKFDVDEDQKITPRVYFVDGLNFIDHMNYNMGTGQIMMKEKELYDAITTDTTRSLSRREKVEKLRDLYDSGLQEAKAKIARMEKGQSDFGNFLDALSSHSCKDEFPHCGCSQREDYTPVPKPGRSFL